MSAKTGQGLDELRRRILKSMGIVPGYVAGAPVVFTRRQERVLKGDVDDAKRELL